MSNMMQSITKHSKICDQNHKASLEKKKDLKNWQKPKGYSIPIFLLRMVILHFSSR